jgi:hypothetical protein
LSADGRTERRRAYSPTASSSASTGCCGVYPSVRST